jgi:hypothetical protein
MPFNEIFKRLLGLHKGQPTCTRLERSGKYMAAFSKWVSAQVYLNWTGPFYKAYHYRKSDLPSQLRVQLVQDEHVRGAVFFYDPSIGEHNFAFLFNLLKDRVHALGYRMHSSDKLEVRHERYTELLEKHVLTPPASDIQGTNLCNQVYGNILLDFTQVNGHPGYIRFVANAYNDPYFSRPLPFEELLEKVLQPHETKQEQLK